MNALRLYFRYIGASIRAQAQYPGATLLLTAGHLAATAAELLGMFIDDGQLALTLIALIAVVTFVVKTAWIGPLAGGVALLAGCIALLLESVYRHARRNATKRD